MNGMRAFDCWWRSVRGAGTVAEAMVQIVDAAIAGRLDGVHEAYFRAWASERLSARLVSASMHVSVAWEFDDAVREIVCRVSERMVELGIVGLASLDGGSSAVG